MKNMKNVKVDFVRIRELGLPVAESTTKRS